MRHKSGRETLVPLFGALKIHALTRKEGVVDMIFQLGMSMAYDHVLQVVTDMANGTCEHFETEGVVCHFHVILGHFTVGSLDYCDQYPASATAHDSFHGTSISFFHFAYEEIPGTCTSQHQSCSA